MESHSFLPGLVFCLMVCLGTCRPQYNYQAGSGGHGHTAALPNLSFNTGSVSSLPSSYNPGLLQNSNARLQPEPTRINSYSGQVQIVPSQPLTQSYLPPTQQYLPPLASTQQAFRDVSQLPLQSHNSFSAIPVAPALQSHSSNLNQQHIVPPQRTIITKDIYVHTAPHDDDDEYDFRRQLASIPIRKNYRIIFIKAPTQNIRVAAEALKQAQAVSEERTVIYVLSKKADVADLQQQLTQVRSTQTVNRKPEVYFIKYKTNEEAQRAQQEIQAQYDALGGSTNISDEGFAPLTSVIGSLGGDNLSTSGSGQSSSISTPSRTYLPPNKV